MASKKKTKQPAFMIRCSPAEHARMRKAAKREQLPLSTWARSALLCLLDDQKARTDENPT